MINDAIMKHRTLLRRQQRVRGSPGLLEEIRSSSVALRTLTREAKEQWWKRKAVYINWLSETHQLGLFYSEVSTYGLKISVKKTEVMSLDTLQTAGFALGISLGGDTLKQLDKFRYLGSITPIRGDLDADINNRISAASATFGKLEQRLLRT
ncbi:unnamed protein product [Leptidea sinapis]|uniref:Uncharacterized protein n=1 Tax=Leptidea sinapis TaxID=189913 RepID=A0A5E4QEL5_9NEOP|nr:unnamed protein product [Leptidea sinapis]